MLPNINHDKLKKFSIMIIDDSASDRMLISSMLSHENYTIYEMDSGLKALPELCRISSEIDLIILDIKMPKLNGFDTTKIIRSLESVLIDKWIPIILLSGLNSPSDIANGIQSGGDDFITKPVNKIILNTKIDALLRIASIQNELHELKNFYEAQSLTDELTQIPNRRAFFSMLDKEISRSQRHNSPLCLTYFDIDNFKRINDEKGHDAGDIVLKNIATSIKNNLRKEDDIGRIGGEEFCIYFSSTTLDQAKITTERYRKIIEQQLHQTNAGDFNITASFGLVEYTPVIDDSLLLLAKADKLLYQAKHKGKNRIESLLYPQLLT